MELSTKNHDNAIDYFLQLLYDTIGEIKEKLNVDQGKIKDIKTLEKAERMLDLINSKLDNLEIEDISDEPKELKSSLVIINKKVLIMELIKECFEILGNFWKTAHAHICPFHCQQQLFSQLITASLALSEINNF